MPESHFSSINLNYGDKNLYASIAASFWVHIQTPALVHGQYISLSLLLKASLGTFCIFVTIKSSDTVQFQLMSFVIVFHIPYLLC